MTASTTERTIGPDHWLRKLGLTLPHSYEALELLYAYRPVGFAPADGDADSVISADELSTLIKDAEDEKGLRSEQARAKRRAADDAAFEAAFDRPDGDVLVEEGPWAGFTRAEATAWCWNLFQYEPHGFTHPGSQVRSEAITKLQSGGLPEVFGYPERAKEYANHGLSARSYREHRKALGSKMFDLADVRHGRSSG